MSSGYENVVVGKLKLKGKPLDVKGCGGVLSGGISKKKKEPKENHMLSSSYAGGTASVASSGEIADTNSNTTTSEDRLTPAERRYLQRRAQIEMERLAKTASKSHRDRIHEFNQYLANLSEHYDIPKVGPG
ncbi:hypothetical protein SAY87_019215 [Trapa incisa]|uniref:Uncharacterized protein n=1 Tax=Trapa incisa TaxID=236973 RepID=A0AAN7K1Y5_9MYRT|nr:hypothetical protein SAY87_019215 [Trapa incisa]